jgi:hypothetical protein
VKVKREDLEGEKGVKDWRGRSGGEGRLAVAVEHRWQGCGVVADLGEERVDGIIDGLHVEDYVVAVAFLGEFNLPVHRPDSAGLLVVLQPLQKGVGGRGEVFRKLEPFDAAGSVRVVRLGEELTPHAEDGGFVRQRRKVDD